MNNENDNNEEKTRVILNIINVNLKPDNTKVDEDAKVILKYKINDKINTDTDVCYIKKNTEQGNNNNQNERNINLCDRQNVQNAVVLNNCNNMQNNIYNNNNNMQNNNYSNNTFLGMSNMNCLNNNAQMNYPYNMSNNNCMNNGINCVPNINMMNDLNNGNFISNMNIASNNWFPNGNMMNNIMSNSTNNNFNIFIINNSHNNMNNNMMANNNNNINNNSNMMMNNMYNINNNIMMNNMNNNMTNNNFMNNNNQPVNTFLSNYSNSSNNSMNHQINNQINNIILGAWFNNNTNVHFMNISNNMIGNNNNFSDPDLDFLVYGCKISLDKLDPNLNCNFSTYIPRDTGPKNYLKSYKIPTGWKGYGLNVLIQYKDKDWLGHSNSPGEWYVGYHGTKTMGSVNGIIYQGFRRGNGQTHHNSINSNPLTNQRFPLCGIGVYFTPDIDEAKKYTESIEYNGYKYRVVFMCRINPYKARIHSDSFEPLNSLRDYFIVEGDELNDFQGNKRDDEVRPYRILLLRE